MPVSRDAVVHQAVVQVSYSEGIVYLDRCGSLTRDLHKLLGKGFRFLLPTVQQGHLSSNVEHLTVTYGPDSLGVIQEAVHEVARLAQISGWAWREVSDKLEVGRKVTRCGIRFIQLFEAKSIDEAEAAMAKSGLIHETDGWAGLLGVPRSRAFVGIAEESGWKHVRTEVTARVMDLIDEPPGDIKPFLPPSSVSLDTDFVMELGSQAPLHHEDLKRAVIRAWSRARELAGFVGERLCNAESNES